MTDLKPSRSTGSTKPKSARANTTALPEVAGDAALYVDPLSEQSVAAGLEKLWTDRAFANALVEKGRRQKERFSWDAAAEEIYRILKNLAGR